MAKRFLIDTNVIIEFTGRLFPLNTEKKVELILNAQPFISVINKIELLGFHNVPESVERFLSFTQILSLDEAVVQATISLRKQHKIKLPDAIIAATALCHQLTLVTSNTDDFKRITALEITRPSDL